MGRLTHTVNGDVASFRSASRVPIESLKFHFLPKQASGTPSPENPIPIEGWTGLNGFGANENLISLQDLTFVNQSSDINTIVDGSDLKLTAIKNTNTWAGASQHASYDIPSALLGKEIFFSIDDVTLETVNKADQRSTIVCEFHDANNAFITDPTVLSYQIGSSANTMGRKIAVPSNAAVMKLFFRMAQNIRDYGVLIGDYIIFHNFCIKYQDNKLGFKDHEGVKIPITFPTGKNLLNTMDVNNLMTFDTVSPGRIDAVNVGTGNSNYVKFNQVFHAGTYTISGKISGPGVKAIRLLCSSQITGSIWNQYYNAYFIDTLVGGKWTFTLNEDSTIGVVFVVADGHGTEPGSIYDLQLEYGNVATAFEPWSPINTFYGGYVDPVAGKIVAEYGSYTFTGVPEDNITYTKENTTGGKTRHQFNTTVLDGIAKNTSIRYAYSDIASANLWDSPDITSDNLFYIGTPTKQVALYVLSSECDATVESFSAWLSNHPWTIVYQLATPIHIPIPAEDMKAFLDHNNFWSDANDVTEVTYPVTESRDILATRKLIMSQTWNNMIPLKYQPVEYISAKNSNPYIDMGIQLTGELEAEVHYYNDKNEAFLFGARKGSSNTPYCNFNVESAGSSSAGRSRFDYGNKKAVGTSGLPFAGCHDGEFIFKFHSRIASLKNVSTGETLEKDYSEVLYVSYPNYNLFLFSVNTNGTASLNTGTGELRVYSAKFWLGGQLVRDFVPCVRKSDSKPGMYDRVSKIFFINVGSDEFAIPT